MKPFSPLYFIKENKARCAVLIFMIFLSFAAYLAGLYVMNVITGFEEFGEELYDSAALVYVRTRDEEGFQGYRDAVEAMRQEEDIRFESRRRACQAAKICGKTQGLYDPQVP